jgi:hypothetical protein
MQISARKAADISYAGNRARICHRRPKNYLFIKAAEIHSPLRIPPQAATPIFLGICPSCVKTAPSRPLLLSRFSAALR